MIGHMKTKVTRPHKNPNVALLLKAMFTLHSPATLAIAD